MRLYLWAVAVSAFTAMAAAPGAAFATVRVAIDLTHQRMLVESAEGQFDWPISSARSGFTTPAGSYAPIRLEAMHYSRKYHMSPMPHAIFFRGGYAIHGTYATGSLGRPASHGCVRLSPANATALYDMVRREGARISISGTPPASRPFAVARPDPRPFEPTYAERDGDDGYRDRRRVTLRERAAYGYVPSRPRYPYEPRYGYGYGYVYGSSYAYGVPPMVRYGVAPFVPGYD